MVNFGDFSNYVRFGAFGQAVNPGNYSTACQTNVQDVNELQNTLATSTMSAADRTVMQGELASAQRDLSACAAKNPAPTGAQQFQQIATGTGAFIGASAPLVGGLLSMIGSKKTPRGAATGQQTVYIPPQQSNTGLIIGIAAAAVVLVLVVVMMKK